MFEAFRLGFLSLLWLGCCYTCCKLASLANPVLLGDALGSQTRKTSNRCRYVCWRQGGKLGKGVDADSVETALDG